MSAANDPNVVRQQFATDEYLQIRQSIHEKYSVPSTDFVRWVLSCYPWHGDEQVLDVGCGPGRYITPLYENLPDVTYHGLDLLPGMVLNHPAQDQLCLGDAQDLPYPADSFDVVMANHMLYHVGDIDQAIVEFRRVLKPDGVLMVSTNSLQTMQEIQVLLRRAIVLLVKSGASQVQPPLMASDLFSLEGGLRRLSRYFYTVIRYDMPGALIFSEIEPAMEYLESTRTVREPQLPRGVHWDDVMMIMHQQFTHLLDNLGELAFTKQSGVLIASERGGYLQQFVEMREAALSQG
jgi:SAM-dependent methyltransferase